MIWTSAYGASWLIEQWQLLTCWILYHKLTYRISSEYKHPWTCRGAHYKVLHTEVCVSLFESLAKLHSTALVYQSGYLAILQIQQTKTILSVPNCFPFHSLWNSWLHPVITKCKNKKVHTGWQLCHMGFKGFTKGSFIIPWQAKITSISNFLTITAHILPCVLCPHDLKGYCVYVSKISKDFHKWTAWTQSMDRRLHLCLHSYPTLSSMCL